MTREDHILSEIAAMNREIGEIRGEIKQGFRAVESNQAEFRASLLELFRLHRECQGPHVADVVAALREEFTAHRDLTTTTKVRKDSDDKISRPPEARGLSDRTIQIIALLAIIALGGFGLAAQLVM